jgi:hypothetical protein
MAARSIRDTMRPAQGIAAPAMAAQPMRTAVTPAPMATQPRPLGQTGVPIFNPSGPAPQAQMGGQPVQVPIRQQIGVPAPAAPVQAAAPAAPPMAAPVRPVVGLQGK